ncbi:MAG: cyclase family protein [Lachnospiraceae bacterium]|nr:cyclase family protein [Lachnospiraceae bacterium]
MKWDQIKMYDLTIGTGVTTPPWPTYQPLRVEYFKRLSSNGANGQIIHTSNHVGTHLDGPRHFDTSGGDIAGLPLDKLCHPGVVVDLSDEFGAEDWSIYSEKDIEKRVEVKEGDILIINTGYHKYGWEEPAADEQRYMVRHPGPSLSFVDWCHQKKLRWIGVDCGSADHPMNTKIRDWCPMDAKKCDEYMKKKYGKSLNEMYPWPEQYQAMHIQMFPKKYGEIIHAECVGGEIDKLSNKRVVIGCFPWKGVDIESAFTRIVAFDGFEGV